MRLLVLITITMSLFAANSLLCRLALAHTGMDAVSFTVLRTGSAAATLGLLLLLRRGRPFRVGGDVKAAIALFLYMTAFSFAYLRLTAATGALIFAVAILMTTLGVGRFSGETITARQVAGAGISLLGLFILLAPALSRPSPLGALMMGGAGAAWAAYSILGKDNVDPVSDTAGNFMRCLVPALLLLPFTNGLSPEGTMYAVASGAVASGLGYVLWYVVVAEVHTVTAALVQLSIPVLTMLGAWMFLKEDITLRLLTSGCIILFGIAYAQMHAVRLQPPKAR